MSQCNYGIVISNTGKLYYAPGTSNTIGPSDHDGMKYNIDGEERYISSVPNIQIGYLERRDITVYMAVSVVQGVIHIS